MSKQILSLLCLLFITVGLAQAKESACDKNDNSAQCLLELVGPEPAIESPVECASLPQEVVYTVHNLTEYAVKLTSIYIQKFILQDSSPDSIVTIMGGSCSNGVTLPGRGSCEIEVRITPVDCGSEEKTKKIAFPQEIARQLVVDHTFNQAPLTADILVTVTEPIETFLTALGGQDYTPPPSGLQSNPPILAVHAANKAWKNIDTSVDFAEGVFNSATCTGVNASGICVAVGEGVLATPPSENIISRKPFVYVSQNGGATWQKQSSPTVFPNGRFSGVSCTDDKTNSAYCFAVGSRLNVQGRENAQIYVSRNGGATWTITGLSLGVDTFLTGIDCTGSSTNFSKIVCASVGRSIAAGDSKAFVVGSNGTNDFYVKEINGRAASLNASSCTGVGSTAVCSAVGTDNDRNALVLISKNGGQTFVAWTPNDPVEIPVGEFFGTACTTATTGNVICTAVGVERVREGNVGDNAAGEPLLFINKDVVNSNDWVPVATTTNAVFNAASCETNTAKTVCVAAGINPVESPYQNTLLYVNKDVNTNPTSWDPVIAPNGEFLASACTQALNKIACTVVGRGEGVGPLSFSNPDITGMGQWYTPTVSPALPGLSCFVTAGASGSSTESGVRLVANSVDNTVPLSCNPS